MDIYDTYQVTEDIPQVLPIETDCDRDSVFEKYFQYIVAGTSILIVLMLSLLEKRTSGQHRCNRPGLIYPVNLLDDTEGRFGYAAAFGSTTSAIWSLFINPRSYYLDAPDWSKSFSTIFVMWSSARTGQTHYLSKWVYRNDPTFRYSTKVICVLTVSLICAYEFGIVIVLLVDKVLTTIPLLYPVIDNETLANSTDTSNELLYQIRLGLRVFSISTIISFLLSSIYILFSTFQILVQYRRNLKMMFKGDYSHLPFKRDERRPQFILSDCLSYAGSQVSYILWGYITLFALLLVVCFLLAYLIFLPLTGELPKRVLLVLVNAIPAVAIYQGLVIIQQLFSWTLLHSATITNNEGKETTQSVLAVDNRKIYHNMSFFLFFFYIVLGIFGCLVRIIKSMFLGVVYLARLDICGLCKGFETWDKGYMYYLSFLYVEESHRHPVMLVFCDILYDHVLRHDNDVRLNPFETTDEQASSGNNSPILRPVANLSIQSYGATDEESIPGHKSSISGHVTKHINLSPERKLARNRWYKVYTLIKNPSIC